jgi:hypothetical protein
MGKERPFITAGIKPVNLYSAQTSGAKSWDKGDRQYQHTKGMKLKIL